MKTAIIGAGRNRNGIGKYISNYLHKNGATMVSVLGSTQATAMLAAKGLHEFGIVAEPYTDFEKMLTLEQPDAVVIASPAETHVDYLSRCIDYGVHIFCEKPFVIPDSGMTHDRLEVLFQTAEEKGLIIAMNSQWPFSLPYYEKICGPINKESLKKFAIRLSPSCSGKEMIPDSVPHALSILYHACGDGHLKNLSIDILNKDHMEISFEYNHSKGKTESVITLIKEKSQPRSFYFGFNDAIVTRIIDTGNYKISFQHGSRILEIPDPLEMSVQDFFFAVNGSHKPTVGRDSILKTQHMLDIICQNNSQPDQEKMKNKEFDFSAKLRQAKTIDRLKTYVAWQREKGMPDNPVTSPDFAPISINLDLTSACNYACPHCVDSGIINVGKQLDFEKVKDSLDVLCSRGLLSVILIGGGEPTLYKEFESVVAYIKQKGLQLGIVTNGSRLEKIKKAALLLEKGDWLRLSLDAARQETFDNMHCPKKDIALDSILSNAQKIKESNPEISLGYSFVIVWKGVFVQGNELTSNIEEIPEAVVKAKKYGFDFVSFKPCLVRLEDTHKESLLDSEDEAQIHTLKQTIQKNLDQAEAAAKDSVKILQSVNLRALMDNKVDELKQQPPVCHMQLFNTVLSPIGIFHCPAFRGVDKAKVADSNGYSSEKLLDLTLGNTCESISTFRADKECSEVGCFYHHVNWWVDDFVRSDKDGDSLETVKDDNFFL